MPVTAGDFMTFHVNSKTSQWTTHILDMHLAQRHRPWVHFRGQCGQFIYKYNASTSPLCAGVKGATGYSVPHQNDASYYYICEKSHTGSNVTSKWT